MSTAQRTKSAVPEEANETAVAKINLRRVEEVAMEFSIVGITPVIPHRWSEKALAMMETKQQSGGGVRSRRLPKNPEEEAYQSCYWLSDKRPGMPATAFKAAMVGACRFFDGLTMTQAKLLFYVVGEGPDQLVPIDGKATMRTDTPRNASGTPDVRYRYQIDDWSATLRVHFVPSVISAESIVALIDAGGRGGVGDWRPSAPKSPTGTFGQFRIES